MLSSALVQLSFGLIHLFCIPGYRRFKSAARNVEAVQRRKLKALLTSASRTAYGKQQGLDGNLSWEAFDQKVPTTEYGYWASMVREQRTTGRDVVSGERVLRYQPTSGSTARIKWIPYTNAFLNELDHAISSLVVDHFRTERRLSRGKHYWSLSWIPTALRKEMDFNVTDDLSLLPWYKRLLSHLTMAVPDNVTYANSSDGSIFATLAYLISTRDLAFISVWSPTFALNLFDQIKGHREELIEVLGTGRWGRRQGELSFLRCPRSDAAADILRAWDGTINKEFLGTLWPKMAMISAWDTAASSIWAAELKGFFPAATFQPKGLWATEGVVTIPFEGRFPVAVTSHFYEFLDLETEKIHPVWNLRKGQMVKPLLSTGAGFFRYALNDRTEVVDFIDQCPCLLFHGRMDGVDMVGEKISHEIAQGVLDKIVERHGIKALSLVGVAKVKGDNCKPRYFLLCEGRAERDDRADIEADAETLLQNAFHYRLARDLNQLGRVRVVSSPNARDLYQRIGQAKGMVQGNMKVEPLLFLDQDDLPFGL